MVNTPVEELFILYLMKMSESVFQSRLNPGLH